MVMVITGICAAALGSFLIPAVHAYLDMRTRATLTSDVQVALRGIDLDARSSVPNSLRSPAENCIEMVPTSAGGSLRIDRDTVNDVSSTCVASSNCSAPLDTSVATTVVDVLSPMQVVPSVGDWIVIGNQSNSQIFEGSNRAAIVSVSTPRISDGILRLEMDGTQFPLGYGDGRFVIVPKSQGPVTYVCDGADGALDVNGHGKGILYRRFGYEFTPMFTSCPSGGQLSGADVVARFVKSCSFTYSPNQGSTEQNGFLSAQLEITKANQVVSLLVGVHVDNTP